MLYGHEFQMNCNNVSKIESLTKSCDFAKFENLTKLFDFTNKDNLTKNHYQNEFANLSKFDNLF